MRSAPVDMGYRHRGNAFGDHVYRCKTCQEDGTTRCPSYAALLRDFERNKARVRLAPTMPPVELEQERIPTSPTGVETMREIVEERRR